DRDFIDRVATTTVAMEGDGSAVIYAGGWSDYRAQRGEDAPAAAAAAAVAPAPAPARTAAAPRPSGLSFTETHRLEALPAIMVRLEAETAKLSAGLSQPDRFQSAPAKFAKASEALAERQAALAAAEEEWLDLAGRDEG